MSEVDRVENVLFLCTGNSARSILAEAVLTRLGTPRFRAFSAGSDPKPEPHPAAIETLDRLGYETVGLRSKSWEEFAGPRAPEMDFIVTVCDDAAGEVCPIWPGHPMTLHWGLPDPAAFRGSPEQTRAVFERTHDALVTRIQQFIELDSESIPRSERTARLAKIGRR